MKATQQTKLEYFFSILDYNGNQLLQPDDFTRVADKISDTLGYEKLSKNRLELQLKSSRLFIQVLADIGKDDVTITLSEWLDFFTYIETRRPEFVKRYISRIANYVFNLFDQNQDMRINREEYLAMFKIYDLDIEFVNIGFDKLDENKDDYISKSELIDGCYDFFLSSDPDAPGNWMFGNWNNKVVHQLETKEH